MSKISEGKVGAASCGFSILPELAKLSLRFIVGEMDAKRLIEAVMELYNSGQDPRPKTVLLVGSGAVRCTAATGPNDTSWPIVNRALNRIYGAPHPTASGDENFVLANVVFKMRASHLKLGSSNFEENRKKVIEEYEAVVKGVAEELQKSESQSEIELRPSFKESIEKETLEPPVAIVTTNWDTLLDKYFAKRFPVMHLHGSVLDTGLMLLPSEIVMEEYRKPTLGEILAKRHRRILDMFEHAETVIIYGLSLDPLDAELNLIVGDSLRTDNRESKTEAKKVVVIDRKPDCVVDRLRHFDPGMNIRTISV